MTQKPLSERIADRLNKKNEVSRASYKAVFLALKQEIEEAIKEGWSLRQIWQTLKAEKKITFTYETFRKYVNKQIFNKIKKTGTEPDNKQDETPEKQQSGFTFNSKPKKENLI